MNIVELNNTGSSKGIIIKNVIEGSAPIMNQNKEVVITENGTTTIKADAGYTGLNKVNVTVDTPIIDLNYLTIEALEDDLTVTFLGGDIEYRIGMNDDWHMVTNGDFTPSIRKGQTISFKATLIPINNAQQTGIGEFQVNRDCNVLGNVMSLIWGDNAPAHISLGDASCTFYGLFDYCPIVDASRMILPASELTDYCYSYMFNNCYKLISAPALPAMTMKTGCYSHMFLNCSKLINAPELPALTTEQDCYRNMFCNCSSLSYIKAMFTNDPTSSSTLSTWVADVAPTGTFVKNSAATWDEIGVNGVPDNWAIEYADA